MIDQARTRADQTRASSQQSQRSIGTRTAHPDRRQQRRIPPADPRQVLRVDAIGFVFVGVEPAQFPSIRYEHFVAHRTQLPTNPSRVGTCLENDAAARLPWQALPQGRARGRNATLLQHHALGIDRAHLTESVADVETHRYLGHQANLPAGASQPVHFLETPTRVLRPVEVGLLISIFSARITHPPHGKMDAHHRLEDLICRERLAQRMKRLAH